MWGIFVALLLYKRNSSRNPQFQLLIEMSWNETRILLSYFNEQLNFLLKSLLNWITLTPKTDSMKQSFSWVTSSSSHSQEISGPLWNLKVQYRLHKSLPLRSYHEPDEPNLTSSQNISLSYFLILSSQTSGPQFISSLLIPNM